ncbi:hypothetical protein TWF718_011331 [Orbilia javanica]|uniref:FAD-dependent oxidoreductase n=1 Tax=Orbilia javanica TaxID=47235 RepID=A0AAN8RD06_9PEZI
MEHQRLLGTEKKSVVIIGAGVGGCASAARLAKAGFNVTVVEKNDFTGGRSEYRSSWRQHEDIVLIKSGQADVP